MEFERPKPEIVAFFESIAPMMEPSVVQRKMFGNPCCFVNGNMFMGIFDNRIFLRLPEVDRPQLLKKGGRLFEPMPNHIMKEYIVVPDELGRKDFSSWVRKSLTFATKLTAKTTKRQTTKSPAKKRKSTSRLTTRIR